MADKVITVGQVVNGVFAPDTSIVNPKIIQVEDPDVIVLYSHTGNGRYLNQSNIPDGTYKFYDGSTELPSILGANGEWIGDNALPYVGKTGDEEIDGYKIFSQVVRTKEGGALVKYLATENHVAQYYASKAGSNGFTGANQFSQPVICLSDPTTGDHLTRKSFVAALIQEYLNGTLTAYQQSENILRILFSGSEESNRVFRTVSAALVAAAALVDSTRHITSIIEGPGVTGQLPANYNLLSPSDIHIYCHLQAVNKSSVVEVADDSFEVGTLAGDLDKVIFENLTLKWTNSQDPIPTFSRFVFKDCEFIGKGDEALSFSNCRFRGTNVFKGIYSLSLTDCKSVRIYSSVTPSQSGTNPEIVVSTNL
jgi:hypothetical protein